MKSQGPHYRVGLRRRREGRTDYRRRSRLLRSGKHRAVVRKTLRRIVVQIVRSEPGGDQVVASATAQDLVKQGWTGSGGNVPAAYLTAFLAGRRAMAKGVREAVLDIGLHKPTKGGRVFAALQGLLDSGLSIPHSPEMLPSKERLRGEHIGPNVPEAFDAVKAKLEGT